MISRFIVNPTSFVLAGLNDFAHVLDAHLHLVGLVEGIVGIQVVQYNFEFLDGKSSDTIHEAVVERILPGHLTLGI